MKRLAVLLAVTTVLTGACASGQGGRSEPAERTTVEVDNRGFTDMTVYVVNGSQRVRLGTAIGLQKSTFTIPRAVPTERELQFLADPIGSSRTSISQRLYVHQGDRVQLVISP